jgi:hypothetical protein
VSRSATVAAAEHNWPGLAAGEGAAPQAASVAPEAPAVHVQAN